jgi:hypothetical protein
MFVVPMFSQTSGERRFGSTKSGVPQIIRQKSTICPRKVAPILLSAFNRTPIKFREKPIQNETGKTWKRPNMFELSIHQIFVVKTAKIQKRNPTSEIRILMFLLMLFI